MSSRVKPSAEAQGVLRALRRAQKDAMELSLQTGTPFWVTKDNQLVDLTKDKKAVARILGNGSSKKTGSQRTPRLRSKHRKDAE